MRAKLPSDNRTTIKKPTADISIVAGAVRRAQSAIGMLFATSPLLSNDDKQNLINHMKGINKIISDVSQRSASVCETITPLWADSGTEKMLRVMNDERNTLTGILHNALTVAGQLRVNNQLTEKQYQQIVRFYRAMAQMHDALNNKIAIAAK